jgi:outer membrane protein, multidrug efflux system
MGLFEMTGFAARRRGVAPLRTIALAVPLAGCLLADKPEPAIDIPERYTLGPRSEGAAHAALPPLDWWRAFRSRELTDIIEQARESNLDVAAAVARIVQADAQARITGAALLPAVGFGFDAAKSQRSFNASGTGSTGGRRISESYQAAFSASYEIDFWGKNRAAVRAAEQTAVAARFDREVIALSTVVAAANAYFQVLAAQDRLEVARRNIASATRVLDLIRQRLQAGTASELDTSQQEVLVNQQRASVPALEQTLRQNKIALAVLMGLPPERVVVRGGTLRSVAIPRVTPGLPSELLTQRPDIRESEALLAATNANVENARAQFLPSITLTGAGGYQSAVLRTLVEPQSAFYNIAAGLTQPIFQGGQLLGNLDLQKGRQDELLQTYRKAVVSAFGDVEVALEAVRQSAQQVRLQAEVVNSSQRAFDISEQRLREGTVDLITVLASQQALFQAQDALVQARLQRLQAIVALYQALGGGWLPKPPVVAEAADAR